MKKDVTEQFLVKRITKRLDRAMCEKIKRLVWDPNITNLHVEIREEELQRRKDDQTMMRVLSGAVHYTVHVCYRDEERPLANSLVANRGESSVMTSTRLEQYYHDMDTLIRLEQRKRDRVMYLMVWTRVLPPGLEREMLEYLGLS